LDISVLWKNLCPWRDSNQLRIYKLHRLRSRGSGKQGSKQPSKGGLVIAVMHWRPFNQVLAPWVGARGLGDMQTEVNGLLETVFGRSEEGTAQERAWVP